jgi:predicted metal-dependent enzyme (double-stranded beta helix superfamily)
MSAALESAVREFIGQVQAIEADGIDRSALARVGALLAALASRRDLFNFERFPLTEREDEPVKVYTLNGPGTLPLQALSQRGVPGQAKRPAQIPHMHPTWAAAAGVSGATVDTLYERRAGEADEDALAPVRKVRVDAGGWIAMMPQDIHSVELDPAAPCLHLLLYGATFEHAVVFDAEARRSRLHRVHAIGARW